MAAASLSQQKMLIGAIDTIAEQHRDRATIRRASAARHQRICTPGFSRRELRRR
jgi:hypothetical protein